MSNTQGGTTQSRDTQEGQRRRGGRGRGRGRGRGNDNRRRNNEQSQNPSNTQGDTPRNIGSKPRLTHFIAIPLGHLPAVRSAAETFRTSLLAQNPPIGGLDPSIVVSSRRLHLTLGVMSLVEEISARDYMAGGQPESSLSTVSSALSLLRQLRPKILEVLAGHPLRVPLSSIDIMKPDRNDPARAHVLFIGPSDDDLLSGDGQRLKSVCELISTEFIKHGLITDEKRPLKLHCTLLNTTYRRPRVNGPRIPFSFRDIQDCPGVKAMAPSFDPANENQHGAKKTAVTASRPTGEASAALAVVAQGTRGMVQQNPRSYATPIDFGKHAVSEIQICRMGSWGPEGEYVCVGKIDL